MYNSFRQTMEQYFSPSANLPNVETVVTEHTPALRSFKVIAEFPLMRARPSQLQCLHDFEFPAVHATCDN